MFRLLILLCACAAAFGALPKGWKACSKSDPKYSECLSKEITNAVKSVINGDKKLGVLPLDPLRISTLDIGKGKGPVAIELKLKDADVYGLKEIQLKNLKNDWKTMTVDILLPKLTVLTNYKIDGKVLVLPITGEGRGNLTLEQLLVKGGIKWKKVKNGGKDYFNMESLTVPLEPKRLDVKLDNLFNGDKALTDNMNKFLNENWQQILDELRKPISDALSIALTQIANKILNKIPASEIEK